MPFGEDLQAGIGGRTEAQKYSITGTDGVRQKFTGYQKDTETQLDFAEAWMYENRHGRFTAVDPLLASGKSANPQTFNRYVYVMNRPLMFTDPDGLQAGSPVGSINPTGSWYKRTDGVEQVRYFKYDESIPSSFELITETNRWSYGTPVYQAQGLDELHVVRLHPNGPTQPAPMIDVRTGKAGYESISDFERNGWEVIWSDRMIEPVTGVRNALEPHDVALALTPFKFSAGGTNSVKVASSFGGEATSATLYRNIEKGEKIFDIVDEAKSLTFTTGNEFALVRYSSGQRALVSGGPGGINFRSEEITRIFGHTHPTNAPPSLFDFDAIRRLGNSRQFILHGGQQTTIRASGRIETFRLPQ